LDGKLIGGIDGFKELAEKIFGLHASSQTNQISPAVIFLNYIIR